MLEVGPSFLESDLTWERDGLVEVRLKPRKHAVETLTLIRALDFRSVLARFAVVTKMPDPYGSVHTFACDHPWEGKLRAHYFRAFLCNDGAMGQWLRIYLYGIAKVFPFQFPDDLPAPSFEVDWDEADWED